MLLSERPKVYGWTRDFVSKPPRYLYQGGYDYRWVPNRSVSYYAQWGWKVGHNETGPFMELIRRPNPYLTDGDNWQLATPSDTAASASA